MGDATVQETLTALVAKLGENMTVRRFERLSLENGAIESYIHGGGRIGVLVEVSTEGNADVASEVAKEVCMQVAAANPLFLNRDSVDQEALEKEKEIYRVQALNEGKPEKIVEKWLWKNPKVLQRSLLKLNQVWVKRW